MQFLLFSHPYSPMGNNYNQHDHGTHANYVEDMEMILIFTNVANQLTSSYITVLNEYWDTKC